MAFPLEKSDEHKGIYIFAKASTQVISTGRGLIIYTGHININDNVVLTLGGDWRLFYYTHLQEISVHSGE